MLHKATLLAPTYGAADNAGNPGISRRGQTRAPFVPCGGCRPAPAWRTRLAGILAGRCREVALSRARFVRIARPSRPVGRAGLPNPAPAAPADASSSTATSPVRSRRPVRPRHDADDDHRPPRGRIFHRPRHARTRRSSRSVPDSAGCPAVGAAGSILAGSGRAADRKFPALSVALAAEPLGPVRR